MSDGCHADAPSGGADAAGDQTPGPVRPGDVEWLIAHLQKVIIGSSLAWAGRGLTLLQLTALHLISALAPVTLSDLAKALGTKPPATSAMVDRLTALGLVCSTPDPSNRRRVQLSVTAAAQPIVADTDTDTAKRFQAVLRGMSVPARRQLLDVLRDTVRRSGG